MIQSRLTLAASIMLASLSGPRFAHAVVTQAASDAADVEFFEKKIRPLLADNCYNCHSANTNAKGGLRVDDRNGLILGGDKGAAIVPGHPEQSLLLKAVRHTDKKLEMPPKKQLSDEQIADLAHWIKNGAAWPHEQITLNRTPNPKYEKLKREHWAWQPLRSPVAPPVRDAAWPRNDIDHFILARLEAQGLKPTADADRTALIRRVTFDLIGLPPSPREIDEFADDQSADAFEKVVDRLLASPAFGERWGRHWLDVARYAESTGPSRNVPYPQAWRYRDYVIDAFNHDKPYDQFIREQIAGDLLPASTAAERDEHLVATGFLALGIHDVNQRFKIRFIMDNVDEQIDTVSRSILALTAGCARCHDHKFDPISQSDYYALAGIFKSSDLCAGVRNKMGGGGMDYYDTAMLLPLSAQEHVSAAPPEKIEETKKELAKARKEWFAIRGTKEGLTKGPDGFNKQRPYRLKFEKLQADYAVLTDPAARGPVALGMREGKKIADTEIRIRGEAERLGPLVPRGFLSVIQYPGEPKIGSGESGRLELSQWLTSAKNPLTPRVMANRVWEHLFGEGLVRTVDNFGVTGDLPSHPRLLDYLATRFVADGWSVKKLVRTIVLSRTYQLGAAEVTADQAVDPADRLVWRHHPRRLDAEEIRDAILAAAGTLDLKRPQASPASTLKVMELSNDGPIAAAMDRFGRASVHRSIYLPLLRDLPPTSLEVFDFADQGTVVGSRDTTTVATQALYLLNDPMVRRQSLATANRLLARTDIDHESSRVELAYRYILGRTPTAPEVARAMAYLADYAASARQVLAKPPPSAAANAPVAVAVAVADAGESSESGGAAESQGQPAAPPAASFDNQKPANGPAAKRKGNAKRNKKAAEEAQARALARNADSEEVPPPASPAVAAWASFCQALFGSAEFRYLK